MSSRGAARGLWHRRRQEEDGTGHVHWGVRMTGALVLGVGLAALMVIILVPFAQPLAWAAVLAIVCAPLHHGLLWVTRGRQGFAAALATGIVVLGGLVPTVFLGAALSAEAGKAYEGLRAEITGGGLRRQVNRVAALSRSVLPGDLTDAAARRLETAVGDFGIAALRVISQRLITAVNAMLENLPGLMLDLVIAVLSLYIFLRDGRRWIAAWKDTVPLPPPFRDLIMKRLKDTTRAVVHGMFVAAVAQGVMVGLGFKLFGIPLPVLFGVTGFFASLLPFVGAAAMWFPAVLWLWLGDDSPVRAAGLFVYGALFVSSIDNVIMPMLVGSGARLPAYAMFMAILGGMGALGPLGLFLGPMVFAVAVAAAGVYRELDAVIPRGSATVRRRG